MSTPIRLQYLELKQRYPDTILFFRLGDFYETFDDDARLIAAELQITLTSKPMGKDLRVPLAGVPYHSIDGHIAEIRGGCALFLRNAYQALHGIAIRTPKASTSNVVTSDGVTLIAVTEYISHATGSSPATAPT